MKKLLSLFLAITFLLTLTSCDMESLLPLLSDLADETEEPCIHSDEDSDELCDNCGLYLGADCPHMDENEDGRCDYCGNSWEYVCENHYDAELDGICDYCHNAFTKVPLETPVIYIEENGAVTWYKREISKNCYDYMLSINGVEEKTGSTKLSSPAHGDVIRVKALAISENGMYLDSEWSEEFIYKREKNYDFLNLGLSGELEGQLVLLAEKPAGTYTMGDHKYIKCPSGDYIIDDGNKIIFFKHGAYECYEIFDSFYNLTRFGADDKYEYYVGLALYSTIFTFLPSDAGNTPTSGDAYLSDRSLTLLSAGEGAEDRIGFLPLNTYTEYSQKIDTAYLLTTYMHPETRTFDWLAPYADKINFWRVEYIGDVWLENSVTIQFTEDFTGEDSRGVKAILKGLGLSGSGMDDLKEILGGMSPEELEALEKEMGGEMPEGYLEELIGMLGDPNNPAGASGGFEGTLSVYVMPFEHEGDSWDDEYKMSGIISEEFTMPYTLQVQYLYKFWYDGGSFATYVRRKEGLYRATLDSGFYVIDKDGNRLQYDWVTGAPIS